MNIVSRYASLVKFSHTIFALPFALIGFFYGYADWGQPFDWLLLVKVLVAMVSARNMAMGFNRYLDWQSDAQNRRTASRDIPAGRITPKRAMWFVVINLIIFFASAFWINKLALCLAPIAVIVLLGYSYTKRFTSWCHLVLGCALAIAPVGAYVAVTGTIGLVPILVSALVLTWVSSFDIIYSLQDIEFDRANNLHSIPARFGVRGSLIISALLHIVTLYTVYLVGVYLGGGVLYWVGSAIFATILIYQHFVARPSNLLTIGSNFGLINGLASICYAGFTIADMLTKSIVWA